MKKILLSTFVFLPIMLSAQLWQNDFSNSADWISTDLNGGSDTWIISSSALVGSVDTINSATAGNGFAQFNSEGQCSGNHQDVVLTYFLPIDISANQISYLEFVQHYKRKKDSLYVEFSNDGLTWVSERINKEYWYYQQTSDPDTVRISIPNSVQSQPFYLRFRYSGSCGFAWLIDDVKIFEKEEFKLEAMATLLVNETDYHLVNHCLVDTLDLKIAFTNSGFDTLNNVVVQTELFENGALIEFQTDTISQIIPEQALNFLTSNLFPLASWLSYADYVARVKLFSADLDTLLLTDTLHYTYDETSPATSQLEGALLSDADIRGFGYSFVVPQNNEGLFCSWENYLFIPPNTTGGDIVFLIWYTRINNQWVNTLQSMDFSIPTTGATGEWLQLYSTMEYQAGDTGMVTLATYGDIIPLAYGQKSIDTNVFLLNNLYQPYPDEDGHQPLIKMTYGYIGTCVCLIGITENDPVQISITPNPASSEIYIETGNTEKHYLMIYDPSGKIVYQNWFTESEPISISELTSGVYFIQIKNQDEKIKYGKFIKH